jgi:ClpP class serine protease
MASPKRRSRAAANVLGAIAGAHWAITREMLETIGSVARRQNISPDALEAMRGEELNNTHTVTVRDGVAKIPVTGPLFRYASFFTRCSGATSYEDLATDLRAALDDPSVRAIVLDIDSPGGEVNGCAEFAGMVFAARQVKPIDAYISGSGCSAAYWIASGCRKVYVANTSIVGSLGTIWGMEVVTRKDETIEEYTLVSSQSPKKDIDIRTAEGRSQLQVMLDALCDVFIGAVAQYRGVTAETVLNEFGQGDCFVGQHAVDAGLADAVGTYEELHAALASQAPGSGFTLRAPAARTTNNEAPMADKPKLEKPAARTQPGAETPATAPADAPKKKDDATETDPAETETETDNNPDDEEDTPAKASAKVRRDAALAENKRVKAIRALPGPKAIIDACVDDVDCTPEMAAHKILTAQAPTGGSRLAALRSDDTGAHAPAGAATGQPGAVDSRAAGRAAADQYYAATNGKK